MGCWWGKHKWQITHSNDTYPYRCLKCGKRSKGVKTHRRKNKRISIVIGVICVVIVGFFLIYLHGTQTSQNEANDAITNTRNTIQQIFSQASNTTQSLTSSNKITVTPNNVYTEDNYYAQLVPSNISVADKGRYNVLSFTVNINVQDLPFDGNVNFEDLYTTIQDQNSKVYHPDSTECALNGLIPIIGKQSTSASYTVCYSVDKTSNKFSIWYTEPPYNYHAYRIGYLSIDSDVFSKYQSHYSSRPIQIGIIDLIQ